MQNVTLELWQIVLIAGIPASVSLGFGVWIGQIRERSWWRGPRRFKDGKGRLWA